MWEKKKQSVGRDVVKQRKSKMICSSADKSRSGGHHALPPPPSIVCWDWSFPGSTSCPPLPVCSGNLELCFLRAAGSSNASKLTYITRKHPQLMKQLLTCCPRGSSNHELQLQVGHVPNVKSERGNYRGAILLLSLIHQTNKTTVYNTHTARKSKDWLEPD